MPQLQRSCSAYIHIFKEGANMVAKRPVWLFWGVMLLMLGIPTAFSYVVVGFLLGVIGFLVAFLAIRPILNGGTNG